MQGFDAQNPPFDRLTPAEMETLSAAMDIGYFAPGTKIVKVGESSDFLQVIIKGLSRKETRKSRLCLARKTPSTQAPWFMDRPAQASSPRRKRSVSCFQKRPFLSL